MSSPATVRFGAACRHTLDHVGSLVRIWTPEEGVVYVNRSWRDLTGTTLADNVGDGWLRCVHADDRPPLLAMLAAPAGVAQMRTDYRIAGYDGQTVPVSDCPSAWLDEDTQQLLGVVHTVTPRAVGPAVDDDRTRTMSKWAHELRGPLNAILGWSDLLGSGENAAEVVQRGLKAIANKARQQAAIIKRMTE